MEENGKGGNVLIIKEGAKKGRRGGKGNIY